MGLKTPFFVLSICLGRALCDDVQCTTDEDCSLNGVCTSGACVCDPGWTTLPEGVKGSMTPQCGYLDFLPSPVSECGPACAFHGGEGGVDKGTTSWGGSVVKDPDNGRYWMFAAEMAQHCTLGQWTTNSQVVSAVSDTPLGPFVRQDIAIPPWSHNPQAILTPDGTWVIFTLGPGLGHTQEQNCSKSIQESTAPPTTTTSPRFNAVNFTIHSAATPHGPWTSTTLIPEGWNASWTLQNPGNWNPAPVVSPDGSVRVMAHTDWAPWAGETILEAPHWSGPYRVVGSDLIDHCAFCEEDPFMWEDRRGNWHVLYHRMFDPAGRLDPNWGQWDPSHKPQGSPIPSPGWAGGHAFSRDGLSWSTWSRSYNTSVTLTDGSVHEFQRRERPKLLFNDKGEPTHLFNGVVSSHDGTYTIVSPIRPRDA